MPEVWNPRSYDTEPWPLDAGLIPFSLRVPPEHDDPTVEEYFADRPEGAEFDLPPPWPRDPEAGLPPYGAPAPEVEEVPLPEDRDLPDGIGDLRIA